MMEITEVASVYLQHRDGGPVYVPMTVCRALCDGKWQYIWMLQDVKSEDEIHVPMMDVALEFKWMDELPEPEKIPVPDSRFIKDIPTEEIDAIVEYRLKHSWLKGEWPNNKTVIVPPMGDKRINWAAEWYEYKPDVIVPHWIAREK